MMDIFSLKGKTALVTGAGKGLGKGMAAALAYAGADIIGVGQGSDHETEAEVISHGRKYLSMTTDLSQTDAIPKLVEEALSHVGKIDILVNNAGITLIGAAESYSETDFDKTMNLNVKSLFRLTQEVGKHMIENKYGKIINIASIQSLIGGIDVSAYVASKHAVTGITKSFANEWAKYNINVNAIAPGFMITDNTARLRGITELVDTIQERIPCHRWGNPKDLDGVVIFLASDSSSYVNGHTLVVDGGYMNN